MTVGIDNNKNNGAGAHDAQTGILTRIKTYMERSRIGDLMVQNRSITAAELREALSLQKQHGKPIGQILVEFNYISKSQLRRTLWRQRSLRIMTSFLLCMISLSSFGSKKARADYIKDVPAKISISVSQHFTAVASYPSLFGSNEKASSDLKAFTKWTEMFDRFDRELKTADAQNAIKKWQGQLRRFENLPLKSMAGKVNDFVNETRYIVDQRNYGKSDYWATPVEFIQNGGDCEDFAIAKYTALRALGVPEERLRIAIVHDNQKNIPHAVLVVYTEQGAYILDNQQDDLVDAETFKRYRPIFSINRTAWWLHTAPKATVLASAE